MVRTMRDLIGLLIIIFFGMALVYSPGKQEVKTYPCPGGYAIIIDGIHRACTNDKQTPNNTYRPKHGPLPMREFKVPDDSWMDKP